MEKPNNLEEARERLHDLILSVTDLPLRDKDMGEFEQAALRYAAARLAAAASWDEELEELFWGFDDGRVRIYEPAFALEQMAKEAGDE